MALQCRQASSNVRITEKAGGLMNKCVTHFFILPPHAVPTCTKVRPQYIYPREEEGVDDRGNKKQGRILGLDDRFVY